MMCRDRHPHLVIEGRPVRCTLDAGHDKAHFNSFVNRRWTDPKEER